MNSSDDGPLSLINTEGLFTLAILLCLLALLAFIISIEKIILYNPFFISRLRDSNDSKEKKLQKIFENQDLLSMSFACGKYVLYALLSYFWISKTLPMFKQINFGTFSQGFILFLLLVIFGKIIPDNISNLRWKKLSGIAVPFALALYNLFKWPAKIFTFFLKTVNESIGSNESEHSDQELTELEIAEEQEKEMLEGVVNFTSKTVKQIMCPRQDIVGINKEMDFGQVLTFLQEHGYSRYPVYKESLDTIEGVLYLKDILPHMAKKGNFKWETILRPAYFTPEQKNAFELFREFKAKRIHMAIAVDEYGSCTGLVTLEDVLEQIVGDIQDEFDDEIDTYKKIDERSYIFEGKTPLDEIVDIFEEDWEAFEDFKSGSVAGMILEKLGDIPKARDAVTVGNLVFEIEEADERRITKVRITRFDDSLNETL